MSLSETIYELENEGKKSTSKIDNFFKSCRMKKVEVTLQKKPTMSRQQKDQERRLRRKK